MIIASPADRVLTNSCLFDWVTWKAPELIRGAVFTARANSTRAGTGRRKKSRCQRRGTSFEEEEVVVVVAQVQVQVQVAVHREAANRDMTVATLGYTMVICGNSDDPQHRYRGRIEKWVYLLCSLFLMLYLPGSIEI